MSEMMDDFKKTKASETYTSDSSSNEDVSNHFLSTSVFDWTPTKD